jgi:hypothetical protein
MVSKLVKGIVLGLALVGAVSAVSASFDCEFEDIMRDDYLRENYFFFDEDTGKDVLVELAEVPLTNARGNFAQNCRFLATKASAKTMLESVQQNTDQWTMWQSDIERIDITKTKGTPVRSLMILPKTYQPLANNFRVMNYGDKLPDDVDIFCIDTVSPLYLSAFGFKYAMGTIVFVDVHDHDNYDLFKGHYIKTTKGKTLLINTLATNLEGVLQCKAPKYLYVEPDTEQQIQDQGNWKLSCRLAKNLIELRTGLYPYVTAADNQTDDQNI